MLYTRAFTIQITIFSLLLDMTLDCVLGNPVNLAKMSLFAFITPAFHLCN